MILLFFVIILSVIPIKQEKFLTFKYEFYGSNPCLKIIFKEEKTQLNFNYLNTYIPYIMFHENDLSNIIDSNKLQKLAINLTSSFQAFLYRTTIQINETQMPSINCAVFAASSYYNHDSGIGLAYRFSDERQSIVHLLYQQKEIDKKMFAFSMDDNLLYLGEVPQKNLSKFTNHNHCKIDDHYYTWGCNLTSIRFNNTIYSLNIYTIFNSVDETLMWSNSLFDFFITHIFKKEIENNICYLRNDAHLYCNTSISLNNLLEMEFGGMKIKFQLNHLFKYNDRNVLISSFERYPESNETLLGFSFFKLFNFLAFDYDNKEVHFYSNNEQLLENRGVLHNSNLYLSLHYFLIATMIFGLCNILGFFLLYRKKNV